MNASSLLKASGRRLLVSVAAGTAIAGSLSVPANAEDSPPAGPAIQAACGPVSITEARCLADYQVPSATGAGLSALDGLPAGYGPADLDSAYQLDGAMPAGPAPTVAIVDAFDDPNAEADLAVYRQTFGLPACTSADGCFRKLDQRGGTTVPRSRSDWGMEISLDLDMVSAICPACHIVLVEADDNSSAALAAAEDTAAALHPAVISNSFGAVESPLMLPLVQSYNHPGLPIVASTGDRGFQLATWPASFSNVIAAGGTTLTRDPDSPRGWTESAWSGAGSGCSSFVRKPSWQKDRLCSMRTVSDVSAVADPHTGVAVYDTFLAPGWLQVGGTSASAPIIASMIARSGDTTIDDAAPLYKKKNRGNLNDVIGGSNVSAQQDCEGSYLCTGLPGYDGPTGLGSPIGTAAF